MWNRSVDLVNWPVVVTSEELWLDSRQRQDIPFFFDVPKPALTLTYLNIQ